MSLCAISVWLARGAYYDLLDQIQRCGNRSRLDLSLRRIIDSFVSNTVVTVEWRLQVPAIAPAMIYIPQSWNEATAVAWAEA